MKIAIADSTAHFRIFLSILFVLSIALVVTATWYGMQYLTTTANDVKIIVNEAATNGTKLATLRKDTNELEKYKDARDLAKNIVAESREYQYQDTIVADLSEYARKTNITVLGYTFEGAPAAGIGATSAPVSGTSVAGLKTTRVNVAFKNPVDFKTLMQFVKSIESNKTRMQIASISLSRMTGDSVSTTNVNSDSLTIEVYIK
jgi:hypothetical protein